MMKTSLTLNRFASRIVSVVTIISVVISTTGVDISYADGLVPTGSDSRQMSGGAMTPDELMKFTGEWEVQDADVSSETMSLEKLKKILTDDATNVLTEFIAYALIVAITFGRNDDKKVDEAPDLSKTRAYFFDGTHRIRRAEFFDSQDNLVTGFEIYESGTFKWWRVPSNGMIKDNGHDIFFDDVKTDLKQGTFYMGRIARVIYKDGSGYENEYVSPDSLQLKRSTAFTSDAGRRVNRVIKEYTYYGDSMRIQSERLSDANGNFLSMYEYYESGNLKTKTSPENGDVTLLYEDRGDWLVLDEAKGYKVLIPRLTAEANAAGVVVRRYEYDPETRLLIRFKTYDEVTGLLTGDTHYTYWDTQSVRSRERYDGDGLLTHRDTRYQSGRIESEYRQSTNQTAYFSDATVIHVNGKNYGHLTRVVYAAGEDYYQYDWQNRLTEHTSYREGYLSERAVYTYLNAGDKAPSSETRHHYDRSGRVIQPGEETSDESPADYEVTYSHTFSNGAAKPVQYRYAVSYHPGTNRVKKQERFEDGRLISVNEFAESGVLEKVDVVDQNTVYVFSPAEDAHVVRLNRIIYSGEGLTINIQKSRADDGTRLVVYDRWMRTIKSVHNTGSWIETQYRNDTFATDAERQSKLKENLFDASGLMVRGLVYDDDPFNKVRYLIDAGGNRLDCRTDACLQYDAGVQEVEALNQIQGASVAVIEAFDPANPNHGPAVQDIVSILTGGGTRTLTYMTDGRLRNIEGAIRQAVNDGFKVINLSIQIAMAAVEAWAGANKSIAEAILDIQSYFRDAIEHAKSNNAIVVVAAGNDGKEFLALSGMEGVVSVGASDILGRHRATSNTGTALDLTANGTHVFSNVRRDEAGKPWSGTSFAAPIVSAAISKLYGYLLSIKGSEADADLVLRALEASADDLGSEGHDAVYGWGKINVEKAFQKLLDLMR